MPDAPTTVEPRTDADLAAQVEKLREEKAILWDKLEQAADVIGSDDPMRIVHDVRNVMNELGLLRKLVELEGDD